MALFIPCIKNSYDLKKCNDQDYVASFENGCNYRVDPLVALRMHLSSGIVGETKFYLVNKNGSLAYTGLIIDEALKTDPEAVINLAVELYEVYEMKLNPVYLLMYMLHSYNEYREQIRNAFKRITQSPADIKKQFDLYLYFYDGKQRLPSFLKRLWRRKIESLSRYQLQKYLNKAKLIDLIRICHAHNSDIDELMNNGRLALEDKDRTWENLRSQGRSWSEIFNVTKMSSLAILRNLNGILEEISEQKMMERVLDTLKSSWSDLQPYRYFAAFDVIRYSQHQFKEQVLETISLLMDRALSNLPKLKGNTLVLSDNSGSTFASITTANSALKICDINNLSSVITAVSSDSAMIYPFSNDCFSFKVSKSEAVLPQMIKLDELIGKDTRMYRGTDIQKSLYLALYDSESAYDNVFIYTDGQDSDIDSCEDVIKSYRRINPKLNVFVVQTAGYSTSIIPKKSYRVANLSGFTGKEILFANNMIECWDEIDRENLSSN